eukprot:gene4336-8629_t
MWIFGFVLLDTVCVNRKGLNTIVRIAGGWVRDKLLDLPNGDIDVALDNMSGLDFANSVNEYLSEQGKETRSIALIQANPDQSKHLETANLRVFGFEIDCVNLRAETYSDSSRIPEIRFGTAVEDAMRRDFTVNALFYNINTGKVEDFTGRGIDDLRAGIIRTPLSPFITFKDDPLRVLRALRFSCRYNFSIDDELCAAASDHAIHTALIEKVAASDGCVLLLSSLTFLVAPLPTAVSRERVLKELEGMLCGTGARPALALFSIHRLGLWRCVFPILPSQLDRIRRKSSLPWDVTAAAVDSLEDVDQHMAAEQLDAWSERSVVVLLWLSYLLALVHRKRTEGGGIAVGRDGSSLCLGVLDINEMNDNEICVHVEEMAINGELATSWRHMFYAATMSGLNDYQYRDKKNVIPLAQMVLRDNMRVDGDTVKTCGVLLTQWDVFAEYAEKGCSREEGGMLIRTCGERWRQALLVSCCVQLALSIGAPREPPCIRSSTSSSSQRLNDVEVPRQCLSESAKGIITRYHHLQCDLLEGRGLGEVWRMKPMLDGNRLQKEIGVGKGPSLGEAIDKQIRWQLRSPEGSEADCIAFLKQQLEDQKLVSR